jgi:hypothetical protein
MTLQLGSSSKLLLIAQIAALWVAVFTLGLSHEMGVNYVLVGGTAPSNPLIHATNDTLIGLIPFLGTVGIAEIIARQIGEDVTGRAKAT